MQYAIIHTATRVIWRLSSKDPPVVGDGETAVVVSDRFGLAPEGETIYWKLDPGNNKVPASPEEIIQSGIDPAISAARRAELLARHKTAIAAAADDTGNSATVRAAFAAMKDWYGA